jgi:hypothetical protein
MKLGDFVRIDSPQTPFHGSIGIIVDIDETKTLWPNNCTYYRILTSNGTTVPFRYAQLIHSSDGYYFMNDSYFLSRS